GQHARPRAGAAPRGLPRRRRRSWAVFALQHGGWQRHARQDAHIAVAVERVEQAEQVPVLLEEAVAQRQEGLAEGPVAGEEMIEEGARPRRGEDSRDLTLCADETARATSGEEGHEAAVEERREIGRL